MCRGYFAGVRVTKRNKATVLLTLILFQTPTIAVHSGRGGNCPPEKTIFIRFLECHINYSLDIWDFFGIYIGLLPPGEKIPRTADTNSNPNPVPNLTEKSFDEMSF
jgi:hypothetical protein